MTSSRPVLALPLAKLFTWSSLEFIADCVNSLSLSAKGNDSGVVFVGIAHSGSPSLHTILEDSTDEFNTASTRGGGFRLPHLSKMQHGDTVCPHRNQTTTEGHSDASNRCDNPATDYHTTDRHRVSPCATASLLGGTSMNLHSTGQHRA
jgi:hypothetical protein